METRFPIRRHDLPLLGKYMTASTAQAVLRGATLRWSSPLLFNDPFDVPRESGLPFTVEEFKSAVADRLKVYDNGTAEPVPHTAFGEIMSAISREDSSRRDLTIDIFRDRLHLLTIPTGLAMEEFRRAWQKKVRHLRIVCFSAVSDAQTMWTHYADQHRGVVLQFESSDERGSATLLATPVTYQEEPPNLPLVDWWVRAILGEEKIDWDDCFREYYYVKSTEWSYEQEYRAVSASLDDSELYYDSPFIREDLRGIILGAAIEPGEEAAIRGLAEGYPNAIIYRARFDHQARRVVCERLTEA